MVAKRYPWVEFIVHTLKYEIHWEDSSIECNNPQEVKDVLSIYFKIKRTCKEPSLKALNG